MPESRTLMAGTGWKMNHSVAETRHYAQLLSEWSAGQDLGTIDIFVLPPFTALHAAYAGLQTTPVATGGQNMHWEASGGWTGEISAAMLLDAGCRYVELAHSERLQHFGETYAAVRHKLDRAMAVGLIPILCLGETAEEKAAGRADAVLAEQLATALAGQPPDRVHGVVLAYEPRWAIGGAEAASPAYVAQRHRALRECLRRQCGEAAAARTRIIYGGSVTPENGPAMLALDDVDGLFVGRAAWQAEGFIRIIEIVRDAAAERAARVR